MAPVIMGNPDRPELGAELTNSFCRTDPAMAQVFARATFLSDNRATSPESRVPTLILQCAQDAIAPPEVGAFVHDADSGQPAGHARRRRPLPAAQRTGGHRRRHPPFVTAYR